MQQTSLYGPSVDGILLLDDIPADGADDNEDFELSIPSIPAPKPPTVKENLNGTSNSKGFGDLTPCVCVCNQSGGQAAGFRSGIKLNGVTLTSPEASSAHTPLCLHMNRLTSMVNSLCTGAPKPMQQRVINSLHLQTIPETKNNSLNFVSIAASAESTDISPPSTPPLRAGSSAEPVSSEDSSNSRNGVAQNMRWFERLKRRRLTGPRGSSVPPMARRRSSVSGPLNVRRHIHVEWDAEKNQFSGVPECWRHLLPGSREYVSTDGLPSYVAPDPSTHSKSKKTKTKTKSRPTNKTQGRKSNAGDRPILSIVRTQPQSALSHLARSSSRRKKSRTPGNVTVAEYLARTCGISDLSQEYPEEVLRQTILHSLSKLGDSLPVTARTGGPLVSLQAGSRFMQLPYAIKIHIMRWLEPQDIVRLCLTCCDMYPMVNHRLVWKPVVERQNERCRTLYCEPSSVFSDWKQTYLAMRRVEMLPNYCDVLFNCVVIGPRKVGKSRLVHSLARSGSKGSGGQNNMTVDPVIDAVHGIYRLGIDFVVRRVVVGSTVVKLQVWDSNQLGEQIPFKSTHVVLICFDITSTQSYESACKQLMATLDQLHASSPGLAQLNDRESGNASSSESKDPNLPLSSPTSTTLERKGQPPADGQWTLNTQDGRRIALLLFGNLTDHPEDRVVSYKDAKRYANKRGVVYLEANAASYPSVDKAFTQLTRECIETYSMYNWVSGSSAKQSEKGFCSIM